MSRTKNQGSPFYGTALSSMRPGPRAVVKGIDSMLRRSGLNAFWPGSGWRPDSKEHSSGTAMDWMIVEDVGQRPSTEERAQAMQFVNWLLANQKTLGIEGILFSRDGKARTECIGYSQPFSNGWRPLGDRGSVSANHVDHVHVKFRANSSWPTAYDHSTIGAAPKPPTKPKPTVPPKPGLPSTGDAPSAGYVPPFPAGLKPGSSKPSAVTLQRQLKKAGFMPKNIKESANYGPQTQKAVIAFHRYHPAYRSTGVVSDPAIGIQGWIYLFQKY